MFNISHRCPIPDTSNFAIRHISQKFFPNSNPLLGHPVLSQKLPHFWRGNRNISEFFGDDLRVCRFVSLALGFGAESRDGITGRMDANLGAVEHLQPEDVEVLRRACSDDLCEAADADSHQFSALAFFLLLLFELRISDLLHRLVQSGRIIAAIILPAERGLIWELLGLDEVFHPELSRVHSNLVGHQVGHALDSVHSLRDAERAAICDDSRRFIGVNAVNFDVRGLEIVRPGADQYNKTPFRLRYLLLEPESGKTIGSGYGTPALWVWGMPDLRYSLEEQLREAGRNVASKVMAELQIKP